MAISQAADRRVAAGFGKTSASTAMPRRSDSVPERPSSGGPFGFGSTAEARCEMPDMRIFSTSILAALALQGCAADGTSSADVERAAEALVRDKFELSETAPLKTRVVVGREHKRQPVMCVMVDGTDGDGTPLPTQYLISAIDPQRWLMIGSRVNPRDTRTEMFAEWSQLCPSPHRMAG